MRLTHLTARDYLGIRAVDLPLTTPVTLLAGANGAGKSSLRDAFALALTGDLGRVSLKKDAAALVRTGAKAAAVSVTDSDGDTWVVSITAGGKMTAKGSEHGAALPYALDGQRFARLKADERREFLFGLMSVQTDREAIAGKLRGRGHAEARIARVLPMLRSGFPAAHDEARAQATAARGAWKAVTGEAYGTTKAETWRAEAPAFDAAALTAALASLAEVEALIATQHEAIGTMQAEARARAAAQERLAALQPTIDLLARRREKLARDEAGLKEAQDALDRATAKAGTGPRVGLVHDLAQAVNALLTLGAVDRDSVVGASACRLLALYEADHGPIGDAAGGDPQARAALPNLTDARDLMATAVRNSMRDVRAAEEAGAQAKALQEDLARPCGTPLLTAARAGLETLQGKRLAAFEAVDRLRAAKSLSEGADKRTADAAGHHAAALAWDALADDLAPSGIPGELLAAALEPINDRLSQNAVDAQWPSVRIGDDMAITYGGRPYGLCSESERWRADAMLAEAIAQFSGVRLLVLDRFDVLDLPGRGDLIAWLDVLAANGELDTALVFGTLKALPTGLPETWGAHWIEGGCCAAVAAREVAEVAA